MRATPRAITIENSTPNTVILTAGGTTSLVVSAIHNISLGKQPNLINVSYEECPQTRVLRVADSGSNTVDKDGDSKVCAHLWEALLNQAANLSVLTIESEYVWRIVLRVTCLSDDGNVPDLGLIACNVVLCTLKVPELEWDKARQWWKTVNKIRNIGRDLMSSIPLSATLVRLPQSTDWVADPDIESESVAEVLVSVNESFTFTGESDSKSSLTVQGILPVRIMGDLKATGTVLLQKYISVLVDYLNRTSEK